MRARTCVLYLLRVSYARVQATVGVGTVIIPYIGVAYTRGGTQVGSSVWRGAHFARGTAYPLLGWRDLSLGLWTVDVCSTGMSLDCKRVIGIGKMHFG